MTYDVIIVGSGASAVTAAYPLVEAGLTVAILDYGNKDEIYKTLVPDTSFMDIRRSDPAQYRYFLGNNFEGIAVGTLNAGALP